jgi:hypothetical protein
LNCLNFDYVECSFSTNGGLDEAGATSQTAALSKMKEMEFPNTFNNDEMNKEGCGRVCFW